MKLVHVVRRKQIEQNADHPNYSVQCDCRCDCIPIKSGFRFVSNIGNPKEICIYNKHVFNWYKLSNLMHVCQKPLIIINRAVYPKALTQVMITIRTQNI